MFDGKPLDNNEIVYNKLVRDKIPDIIAKAGDGVAKTRFLSPEDTRKELLNKLDEEKAEFMMEYDPEELADILEVVYGLAESINLSKEELELIRAQKHSKRGGFSQGIFLESVISKSVEA